MKKLNSIIYLFYYVLLWVVLPSTGMGAKVYAKEISEQNSRVITNGGTTFSDFQLCINPDWNRVSRQDSQRDWLSGTGHWPLHFSSVLSPQLKLRDEEAEGSIFSSAPHFGAFTVSEIIFPFHYFW
tara:strand:- start:327 stop:704 length:378 start_codon:yes stop_codon:yes gene_type:complete